MYKATLDLTHNATGIDCPADIVRAPGLDDLDFARGRVNGDLRDLCSEYKRAHIVETGHPTCRDGKRSCT